MSRVSAFIEKGLAAARAGHLTKAKQAFEAALRLDRSNFDALHLLGGVHFSLKDYARAHRAFEAALVIDGGFPPLLMNMGNCLSQLERYDEALSFYDNALAARPAYDEALFNKAIVLNKLERGSQARACLEPLVKRHPGRSDVLVEYARALIKSEAHEAALAAVNAILGAEPNHAEAIETRGSILAELGRYEEAARDYAQAELLKPGDPRFAIHRAYLELLLHEFAAGWTDYESRFEAFAATTFSKHPLLSRLRSAKRWSSPEDFDGKTVLVAAEQGPGDNIMFASILPDLQRRARRVDVALYPRLETLFGRSFPGMRQRSWGELSEAGVLNEYDRIVCIGSLGHAFRNRREDFPRSPYLTLDPAKVAAWRTQLAKPGRRLIGLSWRGGMASTRIHHRSIALRDFEPLMRRDDCVFVSIQHGDVAAEIAEMRQVTGIEVLSPPSDQTHDIDDLASLVGAMDAVLTVQNTNVHVSGALGKQCLAILPAVPEWRYGARGGSMIWYESVELFRRPAGTGLETLIEPLSKRLSALTASPAASAP
jgi:tetratricopeptide (TPR) repeat protein